MKQAGPVALLTLLVAFGCGDDDGSLDASVDGSPADVTAMDSGTPDGSPLDTASLPDARPDAPLPACEFPLVQVAGTPETDALANAPARCDALAYTWLRSDELGTVLRRAPPEPLDLSILVTVLEAEGLALSPAPTHAVAMQQIAYTTQDRGQLVEATALVAFPTDLPADAPPSDVVLFLHGTSGLTDGCGSSEDFLMQAFTALYAGYGYVAVMPDYIGLGYLDTVTEDPHPYLVGEATAIASLDAIRAASRLERSERGGACMSPRVAMYGISQGGHAVLWTERLAPYYARELQLMGGVAAVPPAAIVREAEKVFSTLGSGTPNLAGMMVAMSFWYGHQDRLSEIFVAPWDTELLARAVAGCDVDTSGLPSAVEDFVTAPVSDAAMNGRLAEVEPWGCMARENDLTTTSVARIGSVPDSYGMLYITGEVDSLVDTSIERDAYNEFCAEGEALQYLECEGAGHGEAVGWSLNESVNFVRARLAGESFTASCPAAAPSRCAGTPD